MEIVLWSKAEYVLSTQNSENIVAFNTHDSPEENKLL